MVYKALRRQKKNITVAHTQVQTEALDCSCIIDLFVFKVRVGLRIYSRAPPDPVCILLCSISRTSQKHDVIIILLRASS